MNVHPDKSVALLAGSLDVARSMHLSSAPSGKGAQWPLIRQKQPKSKGELQNLILKLKIKVDKFNQSLNQSSNH